jgi:DNA polymerase bacteriophage-type
MKAYDQIPVGTSYATVLPDMDFETYSEAGFRWTGEKWQAIEGKGKRGGIMRVGAWVYSEHPSTEILCLYYDMKDGEGIRRWLPGDPPPQVLFDWIAGGGLVEAHNSFFEYSIWTNVAVKKLGWPSIPILSLRDSAAKCGAYSLPRKLETAAKVMGSKEKDMAGNTVMLKLSKPRKPTKTNPDFRWTPQTAPSDFERLYQYCGEDVATESDLSIRLPDLSPEELEVWKVDQTINLRGIHIDRELADAAASIIQQADIKYTAELVTLTNGLVHAGTEAAKIQAWLEAQGYPLPSMEAESLDGLLARDDLPSHVRRVIELRKMLGSAAVRKVSAMQHRMSLDGRLRDLFMYGGAARTCRWGGSGVQPHNMVASGPPVQTCCGVIYPKSNNLCPLCGQAPKDTDWGIEAVEAAVPYIMSRDLQVVEAQWGDPYALVSGCLRGMFTAAPGHELLCSDYKAIEAVVIAEIAGEEWRQEVFQTHGLIYEMSASKITGIPFDEFVRYKAETGQHHPSRKKIGKIAELAGGFGGGVGAYKRFGADKFMNDDEIQQNVTAWRYASPQIAGCKDRNILGLWHGLEDAAHLAVKNPGQCFSYRGITYGVKDDVLYCRLLSGRNLTYIRPRIYPGTTPWGTPTDILSFEGVMTPQPGMYGGGQWMRLDTWYGQLTENVVQATARDLLAYAMVNLEHAGYPIVLHVHDEIVAEVPVGHGSIEEFETIMGTPPPWAAGWPVKATGGWRGIRYRKD